MDTLAVIDGARPLFFTANFGREPLFIYLQAFSVWLLGPSAYALRVVAAAFGLLGIPTTYLVVRRMVGGTAGLLAASWIATSPWPLIFSRVGLRSIAIPVFVGVGLWAFARVLDGDRGWRVAALGGLALSAAIWTYPSGRLAPLVVLAWVGLGAVRSRRCPARVVGMVAVGALAGAISFAPLGWYFWQHPGDFFGRANAVSVFNPEQNGGSSWAALRQSTERTLGALLLEGDPGWDRNVAGQPILDPLAGSLFLLGLGLALARGGRAPGGAMLLLWLALMSVPSAVTTLNVPNYLRLSGALPAIAGLVGLGAAAVLERLRASSTVRSAAGVGLVAWCVWVGGSAVFRDWGASTDRYYVFEVDRVAALRVAATEAANGRRVYMAGPAEFDPVVRFLGGRPELRPFAIFDSRVAVSRPPASAAGTQVLARGLPFGDDLRALLPAATEPVAFDPAGRPAVSVIRWIPPVPIALSHSLAAPVADIARIEGYELPRRLDPGSPFVLRVSFTALRSDPRDLVWFAHLIDSSQRVWAQNDLRGVASVGWRLGDANDLRFELEVPRSMPEGVAQIEFGLYDRATLGRLRVGPEGDRALLGPVWIGPRSVGAVNPSEPRWTWPTEGIELETIGLHRAGDTLDLELTWGARAEPRRDFTLFVHELDHDGRLVGQADAPPGRPTSTWEAGEQVRDRRRIALAPQAERLEIGLYDPASGQRLSIAGGGEVATITLP